MERYKTMKEASIEINPLLKEKCFTKYELTEEEKNKIDKAIKDLDSQPIQFLSVWHTNKVIDFINWYVDLKGLGENNKLENKTIIDSFLRGDKVEVWQELQKFKSNYIFELDKVEE